jgi:hypothetical protein
VAVNSEKGAHGVVHAFSRTYNDNQNKCRVPVLIPAHK